MKCELCHKSDAEKAIKQMVNGVEDELYVCSACAAQSRRERQNRQQSTFKRQVIASTITPPPPMLNAIMSMLEGVTSSIEGAFEEANRRAKQSVKPKAFSLDKVDAAYRYSDALHLEGLYLTGDLDAIKRSMEALDCELEGFNVSGVVDTGHIYRLRYRSDKARAERVLEDLVTQEKNARYHITEVEPRTLGDTVCRSLAMLKNCRLLSSGELFDMLSPLRLAAFAGVIEGIELEEIEELMNKIDLNAMEIAPDAPQRYTDDSARADEINERFRSVILSELGEEKFL